ncbi:MAG: efflux RND transporter periplasmic adaptor subunit [Armatimonadota bacterium]|nr:efflux RND transporter periplasmic adaptor subunit [Armatimonadota bacterium]
MRQKITAILLIILVLVGLWVASAIRKPKAPPPTTQQIWKKEGVPVEIARVILGDMEKTVEVTGDINALTKATLSAKIPGRIAQVYVREGDRVSAGMVIAVLDQQDALANLRQAQAALDAARTRLSQAITNAKVTKIQTDAAIEQAKAALDAAEARLAVVKKPARSQEELVAMNNVASAKANLDNAKANFERHEKLLKEGAIPQSAYDAAKAQYLVAQAQYKSAREQLSLVQEGGRKEDIRQAEAQVAAAREQLRTAKANAAQNLVREEDVRQARAAVRQAEAALALAKQQLSYTYVKSPIDGELASRLADPGQVVAAGQPIAEVVNLASVYFKGSISEMELAGIRKGQSVNVRIDALPGRVFKGTVDEIFPAASPQSRSFPVRIRIDRTNMLIKPGMFARGSIITAVDRNVTLVPKDAVEDRRGARMVFVLKPDKTVRRQDILVVQENREYVEVAPTPGLKPGDMVVTRGRQNLQDGSLVKVVNHRSEASAKTSVVR